MIGTFELCLSGIAGVIIGAIVTSRLAEDKYWTAYGVICGAILGGALPMHAFRIILGSYTSWIIIYLNVMWLSITITMWAYVGLKRGTDKMKFDDFCWALFLLCVWELIGLLLSIKA